MTKFHCALIAAVAIAATLAFTQPVAAIEYPWCAQHNGEDGGGRNCGFTTLEQCMATIRGSGGSCEPNLFYPGTATEQPQRPRKRQR